MEKTSESIWRGMVLVILSVAFTTLRCSDVVLFLWRPLYPLSTSDPMLGYDYVVLTDFLFSR